jgi:hypothetical protein
MTEQDNLSLPTWPPTSRFKQQEMFESTTTALSPVFWVTGGVLCPMWLFRVMGYLTCLHKKSDDERKKYARHFLFFSFANTWMTGHGKEAFSPCRPFSVKTSPPQATGGVWVHHHWPVTCFEWRRHFALDLSSDGTCLRVTSVRYACHFSFFLSSSAIPGIPDVSTLEHWTLDLRYARLWVLHHGNKTSRELVYATLCNGPP